MGVLVTLVTTSGCGGGTEASTAGRHRALDAALRLRPAGLILGGFDAAEQPAALRRARAQGVPVVGWHSGTRPGPDRKLRLFTNVTTDPAAVARLAAQYAIADSHGTAGAVIFTDSEYEQAPFSIAAGDGDASEFERIRAGDYQKASIAESLNLQGWQLIDELNRARAGRPVSGFVAPPRLITHADVPNGAVFDPPTGYRANYRRIWGG